MVTRMREEQVQLLMSVHQIIFTSSTCQMRLWQLRERMQQDRNAANATINISAMLTLGPLSHESSNIIILSNTFIRLYPSCFPLRDQVTMLHTNFSFDQTVVPTLFIIDIGLINEQGFLTTLFPSFPV